MQSLVQIPSNGVTGGCLLVPDSNNWGNDNSRYCSKYKSQDTAEYLTNIMFYYSDSVINPNSFDRAASIWMQPFADPNHYIIASFNHDRKLELLTYFSADYSNAVVLNNNYWYELSIAVILNGDSVQMNLILLDRGANGQMPPIPVNYVSNTIVDSVFARDNAIEVSITGSKSGGGIYLDNFLFTGIKSADSCLTSGITSAPKESIQLINEEGYLKIISEKTFVENYVIYDMTGKNIQSGLLSSDANFVDVSKIKSGMYLMQLMHSGRTFKVILN